MRQSVIRTYGLCSIRIVRPFPPVCQKSKPNPNQEREPIHSNATDPWHKTRPRLKGLEEELEPESRATVGASALALQLRQAPTSRILGGTR